MLRTKSGLPKHCTPVIDRHGKHRVRFRLRGLSTYLTGTPWSEDFMRQYAAALDNANAPTIGAARTKPGTISALVASYYKAPEFRSLGPSTQAHRRRIIEKFRGDYGDLSLKGLKRKHVAQIIADKAEKTPEAANNLVKVLRVMLSYAVALDMIESNPAAGIKRYKSHGEGFHTWTEDEIAKFEAAHPVGTKARLAVGLLRRSASATRRASALGSRSNAALPGCHSAHGLRKAAATRLANRGCSVNQIAAVTGHKSLREVAHYTAAADQTRLARQALNMQLGSDGEQNLSNLRTQIVQPRAK